MDTNNRFIARGHSDQPSREGPLRLAIQSRSKQSPGDQHEEPPSRQPSQPPSLSKQASETISGEASQTNVLLRLRRKPLQSVPEPQTSRMKVSKISLRLSDATQLSSDTKLRVHLVSRQKKELYRTEYLAGIDGSWRTWQANADIPYAFFKAQVYERGALFNYFIAEALVDPFDLSRNDGDVLCEYIPNLKVLNPRWTSMQIKFSFSDLPPKPLPASFIPAGDKVETTSQSSLDSTRRDVDHANEAIQNIHSEALANSLEYLDTVISVLEGVSFITEMSPIAKAAQEGLLQACKIVQKQKERDEDTQNLASTMREMLEPLAAIREQEKIKLLEDAMRLMMTKIKECSDFIVLYADRSLPGRIVRQEDRKKIDDFKLAFERLTECFRLGIDIQNFQTIMTVLGIITKLQERQKIRDEEDMLELLNVHAHGMDYDPDIKCLKGTQDHVLRDIDDWMVREDVRRIFWLRGVTGSGKSTIASTVVGSSSQGEREEPAARGAVLGAKFFCKRNITMPKHVIPAIAYDLACTFPLLKTPIANTVRTHRSIATSPVKFQFMELLVKPLSSLDVLHNLPQLFVVLDAFDECGTRGTREELLKCLTNSNATLPTWFKLFITSRPEVDLKYAFRAYAGWDINTESGAQLAVVKKYALQQLDMSPTSVAEVVQPRFDDLVSKAGGLYFWVKLVFQFMAEVTWIKKNGILDLVLGAHPGIHSLNNVYDVVLSQFSEGNYHGAIPLLRDVLGFVIAADVPLEVEIMGYILESDSKGTYTMETIEATIPLLASVLLINPPGIRFIHPSFGDFLTDEPCASNERRSSSQFFISRDNYVERIIAVVHKFHTYLLHDPPVRSGNVTDDLDRRIVVQTLGASLAPDDDDRKPILLASLAFSHKNRFHQEGHWTDIERAISVQQHAINITSKNHIDKPAFLDNLGNSLHFRFQHFGDVADIDSAIRVHCEAVDMTPEGHANKPGRLENLGNSLCSRFQRLGYVSDIDSAIRVYHTAVDLTPEGDVDKPRFLSNLGNSFHSRSQHFGDVADIDSAIHVQRKAVDLTPDGHASKPLRLNNLGNSFHSRFQRSGDVADIDSAIRVYRAAVDLTPEGHADKPLRLNYLGNFFHSRFQRSGEVADVDSAIRVYRAAVDLTPKGHADKPLRLNNLGYSFHSRFQQSGDAADIDSAIRVYREAVNLTPKGHPNKPSFLDNLGLSLQARFERLRDVADLDSAIHVQRQAVDLTPDGHADKPRQLNNLGNSLHFRFQRLGETADSHAAVDVYRISANSPSGPPSHRFYAACKWALLLSLPHSTSSPLEAYQVALALVPRVPVWLGYDEKLPSMAEVVSEAVAAAIAVGDLGCAFEWLEEGRCLQLRTPLDDLRAVDPALADYLERISNALDAPGTGRDFNTSKEKNEWPTLEQEARKHHHLAEQYERTVEKARTLPGCEDFLRPKRLANLRAVADSGPVVVVDTERCDALVLLQSSEEVLHIPLPTLNHAEVAHWKDSMLQFLQQSGLWTGESRQFPEVVGEGNPMVGILAKLWSGIVHPILLELKLLEKSTTGDLPHVTWCTTSALGFLPLHAAGIYDDDAGPKIFDFVVSSYTPTLSALLNARRRNDSHSQTPSMLAVSQPRIPGQNALQGTIAEIAAIKKVVGNSGIYLNGEEATRNSVLTAMEDHSWIHLACQAHQHTQDPEQSAFILHDSQLDLLSIVRRSLKHTELAFLSGGSGFTENEVQIATGMFMVGYRSVVATMWPIEDKDAPMVVEEFYSLLMEEGGNNRRKVAYALHTAVKRLRDEVGEKEVMRWASFFHIGI